MGRNYLYNLILTLTNLLFPIVSFPYASRVLGPEGIGKVQFVVSFAQYFALFAALGIPIYGIKEIARHRDDRQELSRVYSELLVIFCVTTLLISLIYCFTILFIPYFNSDEALFLFGGIIIFLGFSYSDWFYSGVEDFKNIALRSVGIKLISLLLLFFFVRDRADYLNYLLVTVFSISGHHIAGILGLRSKVSLRLSDLDLKRHLKPLFYIFSTTVAASMYTVLDIVLLGFLADEKAVGFYAAAVKLTKITIPVVTSLGVILMPKMSKALKEKDHAEVRELLTRAFNFLMLVAVPAVLGIALLAPEFLVLFSGTEFLGAARDMQILSSLPLIIGLGHFLAFLILVPSGHNRDMFLSVFVGMVIGLGSNFILIPYYSHTGAAIANVITEVVVSLCYFYFVRKRFNFEYRWDLLIKAGLASLVFIPIVFFFRSLELPLVVSIFTSVSACAIAYATLQGMLFRNSLVLEAIQSLRLKLKHQEAQ